MIDARIDELAAERILVDVLDDADNPMPADRRAVGVGSLGHVADAAAEDGAAAGGPVNERTIDDDHVGRVFVPIRADECTAGEQLDAERLEERRHRRPTRTRCD